ncbi:MAG: hypothetical protein IJ656_01670 [Bacilli bacterium]|nr:hypothetical protein [Bacilli bacterium]
MKKKYLVLVILSALISCSQKESFAQPIDQETQTKIINDVENKSFDVYINDNTSINLYDGYRGVLNKDKAKFDFWYYFTKDYLFINSVSPHNVNNPYYNLYVYNLDNDSLIFNKDLSIIIDKKIDFEANFTYVERIKNNSKTIYEHEEITKFNVSIDFTNNIDEELFNKLVNIGIISSSYELPEYRRYEIYLTLPINEFNESNVSKYKKLLDFEEFEKIYFSFYSDTPNSIYPDIYEYGFSDENILPLPNEALFNLFPNRTYEESIFIESYEAFNSITSTSFSSYIEDIKNKYNFDEEYFKNYNLLITPNIQTPCTGEYVYVKSLLLRDDKLTITYRTLIIDLCFTMVDNFITFIKLDKDIKFTKLEQIYTFKY